MVMEAAVVLPSKSSFNLRVSDEQFVKESEELVIRYALSIQMQR